MVKNPLDSSQCPGDRDSLDDYGNVALETEPTEEKSTPMVRHRIRNVLRIRCRRLVCELTSVLPEAPLSLLSRRTLSSNRLGIAFLVHPSVNFGESKRVSRSRNDRHWDHDHSTSYQRCAADL